MLLWLVFFRGSHSSRHNISGFGGRGGKRNDYKNQKCSLINSTTTNTHTQNLHIQAQQVNEREEHFERKPPKEILYRDTTLPFPFRTILFVSFECKNELIELKKQSVQLIEMNIDFLIRKKWTDEREEKKIKLN